MSRKVMVTVAPTGGMASKQSNPHLPTQPEEIAESVYRSYKAGASIAALHARRPDDLATCNADIYRRINTLVRERCDVIVNNSTGGGSSGDMLIPRADGMFEANFDERMKGFDAGADMATFDGFTAMDLFGGNNICLLTPPSRCEEMAIRFTERGIKPEWEVFNPAHILQDVTRLIHKGYDKPPYYINIVLGTDRNFQGGMPYTTDILDFMVKLLPPQSIFCVSAIGPAQLPATMQALLLGGHVRSGLEDNNYLSRGVLATNEQLIERTVGLVREMQMEPATPAQARAILGLPVAAA
jgi:uncharacterized protein (DUF849 family)